MLFHNHGKTRSDVSKELCEKQNAYIKENKIFTSVSGGKYLGINEAWVSLISTLVITLVLLIFGEIIPKMIAKQHPESVAISVAYIVYLFSIIFYPLTLLFYGFQKIISKNKDEKKNKKNYNY